MASLYHKRKYECSSLSYPRWPSLSLCWSCLLSSLGIVSKQQQWLSLIATLAFCLALDSLYYALHRDAPWSPLMIQSFSLSL
jgi:hypothetical protein